MPPSARAIFNLGNLRNIGDQSSSEAKEQATGLQHESGGPPLEGPTHPHEDLTLQHPRSVFQILKRHFARYTPELVEDICGVSQEDFQ